MLLQPTPLAKHKEEEKVQTMTIELEDAIYQGQVSGGLPHGKGTKKWKDGTTYEGDFVNGKMEGTGVWCKNGNEYKGEFKNDMFNGRGVITYSNGETYEGEFKDGK